MTQTNKISNPASGLAILFTAQVLERIAYYGIRSILVLFLIKEAADGGGGLSREEAFHLYGVFTVAVYLMSIGGGLLSDLVLSRLKVATLGVLVFAAGSTMFALSPSSSVLLSLLVMSAGIGLFKPTATSLLAIQFYDRPEKLDGVFTTHILLVNVSAFIAALSIPFIAETYSFSLGFYIATVLLIAACTVLYFGKDKVNCTSFLEIPENVPVTRGIKFLCLFMLLSTLYWFSYESMYPFLSELKQYSNTNSLNMQMVGTATTMSVGVLCCIMWFAIRINSWLKLCIGLLLYTLFWLFIGYANSGQTLIGLATLLISAEIIFAISELFFTPILMSLVARYGPKRFISTSFALFAFAGVVSNYVVGSYGEQNESSIPYFVAIFGFAAIAILIYMIIASKKEPSDIEVANT
ncbi:peptide MFS transporter [Aliikangiella coralliicola]|uniref:Peptide MFS transporter n=1 Tax=Aliikangiella coralliicola TaxID=2592383 RepID=A0A545UFI2_9GAMM|nr:peptide MFS transporter [Aliikangiella coralliicola]TQV88229.1 peptide MFS transporter [Aliikangiella coralliicola]